MDFIDKKDIPYFIECELVINGLGYKLVELNIFRQKNGWSAKVVISADKSIGSDDCSKVLKVLLPRLSAILDSQDIYMEVTSPGLNRIIKKSTELPAFTGRTISVWTSDVSDWRTGVLSEVSAGGITLNLNNENIKLQFENIKKAKLVI